MRYRITKFDRMIGSLPNKKLNFVLFFFMFNSEHSADFIETL